MNDLISRQAAIDAIEKAMREDGFRSSTGLIHKTTAYEIIRHLPSAQPLVIHCTDCEDWLERQSILGVTISELPFAQPEPLTDKEQRILLAAMRRERKVCTYAHEREVPLTKVCDEIVRKVKGALWT